MKRYALSRLVGTGVEGDPFRPAVAKYNASWVVAVANDDSESSRKWVLATISTDDATLTEMDSDVDIALLPFGPHELDVPWNSVGSASSRNRLTNRILQASGVVIQRDDTKTLREVITMLGQAVDENFNADNLLIAQ